jgi:aconitate hydratase
VLFRSDINPSTRQVIENLIHFGYMEKLIQAGARVHQAGCNGCIGMGQAPATGKISLRTVPRNFPGRSGTIGDQVYLCSPETAAASALTGVITDPRTLDFPYPRFTEPDDIRLNTAMLIPPDPEGHSCEIEKGPNIKPLPSSEPLPDNLEAPVLLKMGDNISTDEIMPAGAHILSFRSNIPEISKFSFSRVDNTFYTRTESAVKKGFIVIAGDNYGQGSSREHAVLGPRYLGLQAVIVKSFARIHWQNLVNFGILPLTFHDPADYATIDQEDILTLPSLREGLRGDSNSLSLMNKTKGVAIKVEHSLSRRQIDMILAGGKIGYIKSKHLK